MKEYSAGDAWKYAVRNSKTNMKKEDLEVLENLEKLLGTTSADRTT